MTLASPSAAPPPRWVMPAAGRVALYLMLWLVAAGLVQIPFGLYAFFRAARAGGLTAETAQRLGTDLPKLLGWPLLGALEWTLLLATLAVTWLLVWQLDREPFAAIGFDWPRVAPAQWLAGL